MTEKKAPKQSAGAADKDKGGKENRKTPIKSLKKPSTKPKAAKEQSPIVEKGKSLKRKSIDSPKIAPKSVKTVKVKKDAQEQTVKKAVAKAGSTAKTTKNRAGKTPKTPISQNKKRKTK